MRGACAGRGSAWLREAPASSGLARDERGDEESASQPAPRAPSVALQDQAGERRQRQHQRLRHALGRDRLALERAGVADVAAAVDLRVGVDQLAIAPPAAARRCGSPSRTIGVKLNTTSTSSSWRARARRISEMMLCSSSSQSIQLEAGRLEVHLVQRRPLAIDAVEIADQRRTPTCGGSSSRCPASRRRGPTRATRRTRCP